MGPRITIIGGGSYQWTPKLLVDFVNTPVAAGRATWSCTTSIPPPLPRMVDLAHHLAGIRGITLTASGTTDRGAALDGADFVVVNISTGGFASMRHDLEIPERHGVRQTVGDSVGPGGMLRALRNIPVFLDLATDVAERCPDAWLLNLTNPMTTICRALTRETPLKTVGLCHEVTITQFLLSLLLDVGLHGPHARRSVGVNHLPFVTAVDVAGDDGLRAAAGGGGRRGGPPRRASGDGDPRRPRLREGVGGPDWTKGDLLRHWRVKLELFDRFGVLPGAGDRHVAEFFPGFLTEESGWGTRWGVGLTTIEDRERDQEAHVAALDAMLACREVESLPSGEMVAPVIQCLLLDQPGSFPLNVPNDGQVADLPLGATVESMCLVSANGVRGRDSVALPAPLAECLRRVSASQELTVDAAMSGDRDAAFAAMLLDPLTSRLDYDAIAVMTDEMLDATAAWLPQFSKL